MVRIHHSSKSIFLFERCFFFRKGWKTLKDIDELKRYAAKNDVPIIQDEGCRFLISLIKEKQLYRILEIGTAIGYSASLFAQISPEVKVTTVELDLDRYLVAKQTFLDMNLLSQISLFNEDALAFHTDFEFDLIFIDASKAQYIKFFERFKENLSQNGIIVSDNLSFHGLVETPSLTKNYSTIKLIRKIKKYRAFLKLNPEFNTEFFSIGDGISVSKKNPSYEGLEFAESARGHFTATKSSSVFGEIVLIRKKGSLYISDFKILKNDNDDKTNTILKTMLFFAAQKTMENGFHSLYVRERCGGLSAEDFIHLGFEKCVASVEKLHIQNASGQLLEFKI